MPCTFCVINTSALFLYAIKDINLYEDLSFSFSYLSASSHPSSYHNTHKKRHHRASPHSDSEVLNYYHGSRHAPKTDHVTADHVTARVEVEVGDPLVGAGQASVVGAGGVVAGSAVATATGNTGEEGEDGELELGNLSGNNSEDEYYQG